MTSAAEMLFTPFDEYLVLESSGDAKPGRNWTSEVKGAGETIRIHGSEIAVDTIYV